MAWWGTLLLPGLKKAMEDKDMECEQWACLEEEHLKVEVACQAAKEQRIMEEEAVTSLLEDNDALSPKAFDLKLREIELQYGLGVMEDWMEDMMVVSQDDNMVESGKVGGSQGEGEKGQPKPRPLTKVRAIAINSIGSDEDKDNESMELKLQKYTPIPQKLDRSCLEGQSIRGCLGKLK